MPSRSLTFSQSAYHACHRNKNSPALLRNIATAVSASAADHGPGLPGRQGGLWARDPTVVVLAEANKADMDASVQEAVRWVNA